MSKYVVCLDLEIGNSIDPEHVYNILIVEKNLCDFNRRLLTDVILNYDCADYMFTPIDDSDEVSHWFCEGIEEILGIAHSPTPNEKFVLDQYLNNRRKELNYIYSKELLKPYSDRYLDYSPIGFLKESSEIYIKEKLTQMILEKDINETT